jgi:hypothetical protein
MSIVPHKPTPLASTNWVTGETTYDVSQMDASQIWRSAVAMAATKARNALPDCMTRIDKAVALVLNNQVELLENGQAMVASQGTNGVTSYTLTNGRCECVDYERAPQSLCKYRLARGIFVRAMEIAKEFTATVGLITVGPEDQGEVVQRCQETEPAAPVLPPQTPPEESAAAAPEPLEPAPSIPSEFTTHIQGRTFVLFSGLLAMATQQGLLSLTEEFTHVTDTYVLAQARAEFHDGRVFRGAAASTPDNVGKQVKPHWRRMALTRAKARCLRDALNINLVAVEELD